MSIFDVEAIQAKKEAIERREQKAIEWCASAALEFAQAANQIGTNPCDAAPDFWSGIGSYGKMFGRGKVYSVLVSNRMDDQTHNIVAGSNITQDGTLWREGETKTSEEFGAYIASACNYSIPVAERLFEAAFLNAPWTVNQALNEAE